jgi:hypothetical protein
MESEKETTEPLEVANDEGTVMDVTGDAFYTNEKILLYNSEIT